MQYEDFTIRISSGTGTRYRVYINCPAASGESILELPFELGDLAGALAGVAQTVRGEPGGAGVRELEPVDDEERPAHDPTADFGVRLYRALFQGAVQSMLDQSLGAIRTRADTGLRIRLEMDLRGEGMKEVASLPWELMRREPTDVPLSVSKRTTLVRALDVMQPANPVAFEPPLSILVIIANPSGTAPLNLEAEKKRIRDSWGKLAGVEVHFVKPQVQAIMDACADKNFHVIHYMGHGGFDARTGEGILYLEHPDGSPDALGAEQLKAIFLDEQDSLRLVFLNACKTAVSTAQAELDPFAGIATMLIEVGVPAVVAMQFPITDDAAVRFADTFYRRLVRGQPVDTAVAEGRKSLWVERSGRSEWATPVLFMRSKDGALFSSAIRRDAAGRADWEMPSQTGIMPAMSAPPSLAGDRPADQPPASAPTGASAATQTGQPAGRTTGPARDQSPSAPASSAVRTSAPPARATKTAPEGATSATADDSLPGPADESGIRISRRALAIGGGVGALGLAAFLVWYNWPAPLLHPHVMRFTELPAALAVDDDPAPGALEVIDSLGTVAEAYLPGSLQSIAFHAEPPDVVTVNHAGLSLAFSVDGRREGTANVWAVGRRFDGQDIVTDTIEVMVGPTAEVAAIKALDAARAAAGDSTVSDRALRAMFADVGTNHAAALAALGRKDSVDLSIAELDSLIDLDAAAQRARSLGQSGQLTVDEERQALIAYLRKAMSVRMSRGPTASAYRTRADELQTSLKESGSVTTVAVCRSPADGSHCIPRCPAATANPDVRAPSNPRFYTVCYVRGDSGDPDMSVELRAPDGSTTTNAGRVSTQVSNGYRVSNPLQAGRPGDWQIRVLNAAGQLVWRSTFNVN